MTSKYIAISGHVSEGDRRWENVLVLLQIIDYLMAPITSHDVTSHLRMLIEENHQEFVKLYPNCPVTPKLHYLIHYPEWIDR